MIRTFCDGLLRLSGPEEDVECVTRILDSIRLGEVPLLLPIELDVTGALSEQEGFFKRAYC